MKALKHNPLSYAVLVGIYAISAQTVAAEKKEVVDLGTTVVTGQKIDRTLQETTAGTSLLSDIDIEEKSALNLDEVIDYATNVNLVETGNYNSFAIRGINAIGEDGGGTELSSLLINGAYLPVAAFRGNIGLWDMEQVVINKGPQSTTQGRNALAGTIVMQTKDPEFDNLGSVRVGVGSHGGKNAAIMLNGKTSDTFAIRLSAQHNQDDGQITNIYLNDDEHDFSENTSVNLKLLYQPSDATEAKLSLGYIEDSRGIRQTCTEENKTDNFPCKRGELKANQAVKPHHDFKTDFQTLELTHKFNKHWTVKSMTSHTHIQEDDSDDWLRQNPDSDNYPKQNGERLPVSTSYNGWERDTLSQEFRVNYETDKLRTSTGLYGAKNETQRFRKTNLPLDFKVFLNQLDQSGSLILGNGQEYLPLSVTEDGGEYNVDTLAIFNDTDFDVNEKLTINAGLRLEKEKVFVNSKLTTTRGTDLTEYDGLLSNIIKAPIEVQPGTFQEFTIAEIACNTNPQLCGANATTILGALNGQQIPDLNTLIDLQTAVLNQAVGKSATKETHTVLPKLGFRYKVNDNTTVGYLYSRGYRSGGVGVNPGTGAEYDYKPEFLDNHEISVRNTSPDKHLTTSANLYYADWKDQQVTVFGNANPYDQTTVNAADSRLYGFEFETKYSHDNGVFGFANLALSDTEYKTFDNNGANYSGNEFKSAPRLKSTLGLGYYANNGFNGNISTRTTTGSYQEAGNFRKSKGYTMTDLRIGYEGDSWRINSYVKNLFDKKVEHRYWTFTNTAYASTPVFLPERSFGMNVQYDF